MTPEAPRDAITLAECGGVTVRRLDPGLRTGSVAT
jgi:hypothetical protein